MKLFYTSMAVAAAVAAAAPASATVFFPNATNFVVSGNIASGPITASISNSGIAAGDFTDTFQFRIPQNGFGSGAVTTGTTTLFSATDLDITSVLVNNLAATKVLSDDGRTESFSISGVPIFFNEVNSIVITGVSRGLGAYGGNATFEPSAVPEPATWALMMGGLGVVGGALRRRKKKVTVSFA